MRTYGVTMQTLGFVSCNIYDAKNKGEIIYFMNAAISS